MQRYAARAEFRRLNRDAPWVIAGVWVRTRFFPAVPGVEPVRARLPDAGLVGWTALPSPVLAPGIVEAGSAALEVARAMWPKRDRRSIPYPHGTPEPG